MSAPMVGGDEVDAIVVDVGAYQCKAGYAGEDAPKVVLNTAVGAVPEDRRGAEPMDIDPPSTSQENSAAQAQGQPAGEKARWQERRLSVLKSPYVRPLDHQEVLQTLTDGVVTDWDRWECVVHSAVRGQLGVQFTEHPMLLSEPTNVSKDMREKMVERTFEAFKAPAVFLAKNAVLSSFALGRQTSLVLDVGYDGTVVSAVNDGYVLRKSVLRSPVGGRVLDECLQASLAGKDLALQPWYAYSTTSKLGGAAASAKEVAGVTASHMTWATRCLVADIKETICRMNEQPFIEEENVNMPMQSYELPDGSTVNVGVERFKIPEILFNPMLIKTIPGMKSVTGAGGQPLASIAEMVITSCSNADVDLRKDLYAGVLLTGGSSLFMSTKERLDRELLELAPQAAKIKVTTHSNATERKFSVWLGGSILGCLGSFHQLWMSKQEYEESGASLIHRKSP